MELIFQTLVGLAGLALLGLGAMSMFAPKRMVKNFAIEPIGAAGLSTIRAVIGGLFLASVALLVSGLITGQTLAFIAVAVLMGVVATCACAAYVVAERAADDSAAADVAISR